MKFALVLLAACSTQHCVPASRPADTKLYSSYHACWVHLVPKIYYGAGRHGTWKCVSRADPVAQISASPIAAPPGSAAEAGQLVRMESGGDPHMVNRFGYAGLFQFGAPLLADLGLYSPGPNEGLETWSTTARSAAGKWSGTFTIPGYPAVRTLSDFLENPAAQFAAYTIHRAGMERQIVKRGLADYLDQKIEGTTITRTGLLYMIHLGGAGGAQRVLQTHGRRDAADANGTTLLDYARIGATLRRRDPADNDPTNSISAP